MIIRDYLMEKEDLESHIVFSDDASDSTFFANRKMLEDRFSIFLSDIAAYVPQIKDEIISASWYTKLRYEPVKEFLLGVLEDPRDEICPDTDEEYPMQYSTRWNKMRAASYLVQMNSEIGKEFILDLSWSLSSNEAANIMNWIGTARNKMSIDLFINIFDKNIDEYKKIDLFDRQYFANVLNKSTNRVFNEYDYYKNGKNLYHVKVSALWAIELFCREDKKELANLVELFEGLPEENEKDLTEKFELSSILVNVKYQPISEFLIKKMSRKYNVKFRLEAACQLIRLGDDRGIEFIKRFMRKINRNDEEMLRLFIDQLLSVDRSVSRELLLEFVNKYMYSFMDRFFNRNDYKSEYEINVAHMNRELRMFKHYGL